MLDGHSPIAHGNTLDVSENIKNGKIRLDNIAPTLTISGERRDGNGYDYWTFTINNSGGSPFYKPTVLETKNCFSIAKAKGSTFDSARHATYVEVGDLFHGTEWTPVGNPEISFTWICNDRIKRNLDREFNRKFWLKIQGLEDHAGNALWGGPGSDACYVLGKYSPSAQGDYVLSVVLPQ